MRDDLAERIHEELVVLRRGQEALQHGQRALSADIAVVKLTAPECETTTGLGMSLIGHLQMQIASQTSRIDRFEERLERIERRLDRVEA